MTDPGAHPVNGHLYAADGTVTPISRAAGTGHDGDVILTDTPSENALRWTGTGWEAIPTDEARRIIADRS